jgi:excisionase family DNA binding protein
MGSKLLSLPEAAKRCAVSRWTLRSYVRSGELKAFRTPGGHYRIAEEDLTEFASLKKMHHPARDDVRGGRILVADDDAKTRKLLVRALSVDGIEVKTANDGFEAGQLSITFKPHIMILDLFMPRMDGFQVCRRLKQNPETQEITVIAISGFATPENWSRIKDCGADCFFAKPLEIKALLQKIRAVLKPTALPYPAASKAG